MGTTAEKLNYLKETKTEIKNALETPSNIFRDYPNLIKKYIDNQPTKFASDGICSNAVDLPAKLIEVDGNSEQKIYEGYNLFNNNSQNFPATIPGLEINFRDDGSISAKGTATGTWNRKRSNGNIYNIEAGTYTLYLKVNGSCPNAILSIALEDADMKTITSGRVGVSNSSLIKVVTFTCDVTTEIKYTSITLEGIKTNIAYNCTFYPMLLTGAYTTDVEYESYTGRTPSPNPNYPQKIKIIKNMELKQSGTNILDIYNPYLTGKVYNNNGIDYDYSNANTYSLKLKDDIKYYVYVASGGSFWTTWKNGEFVSYEIKQGMNTYEEEKNDNYDEIRYSLFITENDFETSFINETIQNGYAPYHETKVIPIDLQGNTLAKVGDIKDKLRIYRNGDVEIEKNVGKYVFTGDEVLIDNSSTSIRKWWGINFSNYGIYQYNDPTKVCDVLTTKFKSRPQQGSFLPGQVALTTNSKNMYFVFEPDTTEEQARAILTDMPVYFRLAEPQTIKLSSISPIELWQGTNIFKLITNLDTTFEVEYIVNKDSVLNEVQTAMLEAEIEI